MLNQIYLVCITLLTILFVYGYNQYHKRYIRYDIMNTKITKITDIKICLWNIMHIVYFYVLCAILKPNSVVDFLYIFMMMLLWMGIEYVTVIHICFDGMIFYLIS